MFSSQLVSELKLQRRNSASPATRAQIVETFKTSREDTVLQHLLSMCRIVQPCKFTVHETEPEHDSETWFKSS